jgi:hypothetical protein
MWMLCENELFKHSTNGECRERPEGVLERERERARLCKGYFCFVSLGFSWKADTSGNSMSTA